MAVRSQIGDAELDAMILRALGDAPQGISENRLMRALPAAFRPDPQSLGVSLARLVTRNQVHAWPGRGRVHAVRPFDEAMTDRLVARLRGGPATASEIRRALPAVARGRVPALLRKLVGEGQVFKHPRLGRRDLYGLQPAEAVSYVEAPLRRLVAAVVRKGFDAATVRAAVVRAAGGSRPAEKPAGDEEAILGAIEALNPQARAGALVYVPHVRAAVAPRMGDPGSFDACVLALAAQGRVQVQVHPIPSQLTPAEREAMVSDGAGGYYSAIGLL
jgi:hypothetical protein